MTSVKPGTRDTTSGSPGAQELRRALRARRPEAGLELLCAALCGGRPGIMAVVLALKGRRRLSARARTGPWDLRALLRLFSRGEGVREALSRGEAVAQGLVHALPLRTSEGFTHALVFAGEASPPPAWEQAAATAEALLLRQEACIALQVARQEAIRARVQKAKGDARARRAVHDLKSPLVVLMGTLDMIRRGMAGPTSPTLERYLTRLTQAVGSQRALIDALLTR